MPPHAHKHTRERITQQSTRTHTSKYFILKMIVTFTNFTVSPCISIHYLYMFQQMHLRYYNTNFSVIY
jgi:hypothetical protein